PADTFHLGRGYFLMESNPNVTLSLTIKGTPQDPAKVLPIPLHVGWNMIGDPFTFPLNFQDLKVQDGSLIVAVGTAQSGSNPSLGGALWTYQNGVYQFAYTVDPWRGYWLRAYRPVTLLMDPSARQDRSAKIGGQTRAALDFGNVQGQGWKLLLQ